MVKLKNIVIDGNIAKCDIYPEDSKINGTLEVDLLTQKLISYTLPIGYEGRLNYVAHAHSGLIEIAKLKDIPKERTVAWY